MHFALVYNSCWKNLSPATKELIADADLISFSYGWRKIADFFLCLNTALGYQGRNTHPAQHLGTCLPPRTEAKAVSCTISWKSSPYPCQKAEEGSQISAYPLPELQVLNAMDDAIMSSGGSWLIHEFPGSDISGSYQQTLLTIPHKDLEFISRKECFSSVL